MAWKRKSGVVSMTMLRPLHASKIDGLVRLSRGSGESQTAQWQANVGTPMEVPEPKTVNWRTGISKCRAGMEFDSSPADYVCSPLGCERELAIFYYYVPLAFLAMASAAALEISINVSFKLPKTS